MRRRLVAATPIAAALALALAGASLAAETFVSTGADSLKVTDLVLGQAKTGPYTLSWNQIAGTTASVTLNGAPLLRGVDYTLDEQAGTVTFTKALERGEVANVTYLRRPDTSKRNAVSFALPIAESLRGPLGSTLGASYLYQRSADDADTLTHGFTGALRAGQSGVVSGVLLLNDPVADSLGTETPRRSGWRLAGEESVGRLSLTASLARADEGLVGAEAQSLSPGVESLDLGAVVRAADSLNVGATFARRRDLTAEDTETRALGYTLAYQPSAAAGMALAHTTTISEQDASSLVEDKTDYTFLYKSPIGVTVGASLSDVDRDQSADEATAKYALNCAGRDGFSIAAARITESSEADDGDARALTDRFSLKTRVGPRSLATAAHEVQHTDDGCGAATSLGLTTAFVEGVDLEADYLTSGIATPQTASHAGFKVTAIPMTRLSGRVGTERVGAERTDLAGIEAVITPRPAVSLGGGITRRSRGAGDLDTKTATLTLAPGDAVRLTGEYAENPTNDAGQPLLAARAKVNLTTKVGAVTLEGSAGREKDVAGVESAVYEAQLGLRLGRSHRVYTGYSLNDSLAPDLRTADEVYRVGYGCDAGSDFSLSLEGQVLLHRENGALLAEQTEHRAQASLSARF